MKRKIINCIIVIGTILFAFGFYAEFFKAGLPIQDPTPEITREWMFYHRLGDVIMPLGVTFVIIGTVFKIFIKLKKK